MALPERISVKISSEAAGSISITPVVRQELAAAQLVENILRVIHIDSLYFVSYPEAKYARRIKVGQKAEMQVPLYGNEKIVGDVAFVDPSVDPSSGSFRVKVLVKNPDHKIPPGLQGMVTFLPGT